MQNLTETQHEQTIGLLQDTLHTNPPGIIKLTRVTGDEKHELISFENVPEIINFYTQRGVAPGVTQATNAVSIRVLAVQLKKRADELQMMGVPAGFEMENHANNLQLAVKQLKKEDGLLCSYILQKPITM